MHDIVSTFFEGLGGPHSEIPETISGRLRFDLDDAGAAEHWTLTFDGGTVAVEHADGPADCVVRTDRATMAAILDGSTNPMASLLRGTLTADGQRLLLVVFRVLLPPPSRSAEAALSGGRRS